MTIRVGSVVGPYEVIALQGAGGMGDVYRARDTRLGRHVALKVLPERFRVDAERLARFTREAHVLASLNHPNITTLHAIEEADGRVVLVLEFVDGETLTERLAGGPLPLGDALDVAKQIVDGLAAAHDSGIVHCDLKPSNIMVRDDGTVKILDFGLAQVLDPAQAGGPASDTMTSPLGRVGAVFGTVSYMSPEQADGRSVDKRGDIWAFGCVLYEMLTTKRAFEGETPSAALAAILARDPDWRALSTGTPLPVRRLLHRCLTKDRKHRLADIADARLDLEEVGHHPAPPDRTAWRRAAITLGAVAAISTAAALAAWLRPGATPRPRVTRLTITPASMIVNTGDRAMAMAPDASSIAYIDAGRLVMRAMDALDATPLTEADIGLRGPFFSPNAQWLGFVTSSGDVTTLAKVATRGGPIVRLCTLDGTPRGALWRTDGTIVFATASLASGLWRVSDAGGEPTPLTTPDPARGELDHLFPEMLPDGHSVLFTVTPASRAIADTSIAVLDGRTGAYKIVIRGGSHAHFLSSGYLVYAVGNTLRAIAFDPARMETTGAAVAIPPAVITVNGILSYFDVATDGSLVYGVRDYYQGPRHLTWVDRSGREQPIHTPARAFRHPRISPDGRRVAVDANDGEEDIWMWDGTRETFSRFTFGTSAETNPVWAIDGQHLLFHSNRGGRRNIYWQPSDGAGSIERLTDGLNDQEPTGMLPHGTHLVITEFGNGTPDLMLLPLPNRARRTPRHDGRSAAVDGTDGEHRNPGWPRDVQPLLQTPDNDQAGEISSDGKWLAYVSYQTGRGEIYVRPFPDVNNGLWQVSTAGGKGPVWSRDGRELFYADASGALVSVGIQGAPWNASPPTVVFPPRYFVGLAEAYRTYDVAPDGQRFIMITNDRGAGDADRLTSLHVVLNWAEEVKRLVSAQ